MIPNASGGDGADIGAFELQPALSYVLAITSFTKVAGGGFLLQGQGVPNAEHRIEVSSNLSQPYDPDPIGTVTADSMGNIQFTDSTDVARRFYRLVYP